MLRAHGPLKLSFEALATLQEISQPKPLISSRRSHLVEFPADGQEFYEAVLEKLHVFFFFCD